MRKFFIYISLCSCLLPIGAQQSLVLTTERNSYHADDIQTKQQVVFRDPGSKGKELRWDFRHLQPIEEEYTLRYFIPDSSRMHDICGLEHRTRYYYHQQNDSVWSTGYENHTTYMKYTKAELKMRYPFTYGDTLRSEFEGKGEYGRRLQLAVKGSTRIEADAEGELILPDETIKKALRVHTQRHYTETGRDSLQMTYDTYCWYAQGVRYPVFESIKTTVQKGKSDTTVFTTSFYYPPQEQYAQLNDSPLQEEAEGSDPWSLSSPPSGELEGVFTEADLLPNPVIDILYINYRLTRNAKIRFSVHNNAGVAMVQTATLNQTEGYHQTPVNMTGFIPGVYTLYVHVDDMVMSLNVVKK